MAIVDGNRSNYEANSESLDEAEDYLEKFRPQEDAWPLISPETGKDRLECQKEHQPVMENTDDDNDIPDLKSDKDKKNGL